MKNRLLNLIIITVCFFLIINLSRSIWELWGAGGRVDVAQKELSTSQKKNQELKKKLIEAQSPQYVERIARDNLGMAKEGETVVILPKNAEQNPVPVQTSDKEANWQKWLKVFFD